MRYKSDWEKSKARLEAFWQGELLDRCCISVKAFDKNAKPLPNKMDLSEADRIAWWTDPEAIITRNRYTMEHTYYGGDSFPAIFINLGAAGHAGFFKGERHYLEDSVWFFPSLEDPNQLEFDESGFLYQKTLEHARAFAEDSRGDYLVSMPDCTGNADALSHLMGPENLMVAMIEDPKGVKSALKKIDAAYHRVMKQVWEIVKGVNGGGGVVDWLGTYAPGFHAQMQCDMSVMISNPAFREFIMPELRSQCELLDYPLYHFDGIEQIRHLDDLLSIPNLRAIQWTQVAGQPPATDYIPELQKIQRAGKRLIIWVNQNQIEPLMENLSSRGLLLLTDAQSREEADEVVRLVSRLTRE